ncbi:hypothetical protein, partial [Longimicrobium sp.]|uniref:hypothetical protein n=1 Tax=Longimicrobium sp. TaxID=2029185 RepID=UPI002ED9F0C9
CSAKPNLLLSREIQHTRVRLFYSSAFPALRLRLHVSGWERIHSPVQARGGFETLIRLNSWFGSGSARKG